MASSSRGTSVVGREPDVANLNDDLSDIALALTARFPTSLVKHMPVDDHCEIAILELYFRTARWCVFIIGNRMGCGYDMSFGQVVQDEVVQDVRSACAAHDYEGMGKMIEQFESAALEIALLIKEKDDEEDAALAEWSTERAAGLEAQYPEFAKEIGLE